MSELSEGGVCEHCNVSDCFHDRDHLATECYPKQIDALTQRVADMTRALEAARNLSTAMVDAEAEGGDFELVDAEWQALTEAIVACDAALASSDSKIRERGSEFGRLS